LNKATDKLQEHIQLMTKYVNETNTKFASFKEEFLLYSDLNKEQIDKLTREELFDCAYILYGYSSYIQDEINRNKIALNWCNDQLENLIANNSSMFGQYTKHESKRHILVNENSFAASIDNMRLVAEARLQALDGKTYELKRKADILLEKGKRL
jgi:hypothetical protein